MNPMSGSPASTSTTRERTAPPRKLRRFRMPSLQIHRETGAPTYFVRLYGRVVRLGRLSKMSYEQAHARFLELAKEDLALHPFGVDCVRRIRTTGEIHRTQTYGARADHNHRIDVAAALDLPAAPLPGAGRQAHPPGIPVSLDRPAPGFVARPDGYRLAADSEGAAEVYSLATTRDQARIVFGDAQAMARQSAGFRSRFGVGVGAHNIHVLASGSKFEALSAESSTLDGLNIHFGCIDELHA